MTIQFPQFSALPTAQPVRKAQAQPLTQPSVLFGAEVISAEGTTGLVDMLEELIARMKHGIDEVDVAPLTEILKSLGKGNLKLPLGKVTHNDQGQAVVTSWAGGKISEKTFESGRTVYGPGTDVDTFLNEITGGDPALVICPVGWSAPSPDILATVHEPTSNKFAEARTKLEAAGLKDEELEQKLTKAKKAITAELYETAFEQWWQPIEEKLDAIIEKSDVERKRIVFLTSSSWMGVDKAAMKYAEKNGLSIGNVTPFCYAGYADDDQINPNVPLLITNDIEDYADACAEGADVLIPTGGRDHSIGEDVYRGLINRDNLVTPADIMDDVFGISIPATVKADDSDEHRFENVARYLKDIGLNPASMALAKEARQLEGLTDSQRHVVAALEKMYLNNMVGTAEAAVAKVLGT